MAVNLTHNAISMMCNGGFQGEGEKPVVQVTHIKLITAGPQCATERYRMWLSDGMNFQQGMLVTQNNDLVHSGRLQKGSIVQLCQFVSQVIQNRKIIIIIELNVILENCDIIGDPKEFAQGGGGGSASHARPSMKQTGMATGNPQTGWPDQVGSSNTYSRPLQSTYQQPPPMYMNIGPIAKNEAPTRVIPIAGLNPYQGSWTIKARVTSKMDLGRYNSSLQGVEKVLSFVLLDSDRGEIQVTCFNAVADQFNDKIEVGKVYLISGGALKPASSNNNFNRLSLQNKYEIFLENTSIVQPCMDDSTIPWQRFHSHPISDDLESMVFENVEKTCNLHIG